MTIKEVKNLFKNSFCELEVYEPTSIGQNYPMHFHTDNCISTEDYTDDSEIELYDLMDEDDYNNSILANSSECLNFEELYDDKNAKILCVMLKENGFCF